jgi:hypothetical protein
MINLVKIILTFKQHFAVTRAKNSALRATAKKMDWNGKIVNIA